MRLRRPPLSAPRRRAPRPSAWLAGALLAAAAAGCTPDGRWPLEKHARHDAGPIPDEDRHTGSFYEDNPTYLAPPLKATPWRSAPPETLKVDGKRLNDAVAYLQTLPQSLGFLVFRHGTLLKEAYLHDSGPTKSYNIHSASKGIISALVGIALQQGKLASLDQTLPELLPYLQIAEPAKRAITLRDLLTMSAGFAWTEDATEASIEGAASWLQAIVDLPLATKPGAAFNYCTGQSHLISAILQEATGKPTHVYAAEALLAPLGITAEHWGRDPQGIDSGGYNVYMTARALATFGLLAQSQGRLNGKQLVPAAWMEAAWVPSQVVDDNYHYGYYWWLPTVGGYAVRKLWGYGGQFVLLLPDFDALVVLTADTSQAYDELDADQFLADYIIPAME